MADEFLMKGKVYGEHKHKLVYPVIAEIKYDEIRLHVHLDYTAGKVVQFLSYAGKPLHNLDSWAQQFYDFMTEQNVRDLDMGVLVNGNFNDSYRWCRSSTGIPGEKLDKKTGKVAPALDTGMVVFYLFDWPESTEPYESRRKQLRIMSHVMREAGIPVARPLSYELADEAALDKTFTLVREEGFEGLMVKSRDHTYQPGKRIDGWLKMKPENEADGLIVKVNQAFSIHGEPLDRAGSVDVAVDWPDVGLRASPAGIPHELGRLMWANPEQYEGKQWVEFKYMERDRQGGYRHPSLVRLREPK